MLGALDDTRFTVVRSSGRSHLVIPPGGVSAIARRLADLDKEGEPLRRPWGQPDNLDTQSGWVEDCWSDEAWMSMTQRITQAALSIYLDLVNRWFSHLTRELPTLVSFPVEIDIRLEPKRSNGLRTWAQLWRPLAPDQPTSVRVTTGSDWTLEEIHAHWERWTAIRGATTHRSRSEVNHYATPLWLTGDRPASVMAYKWLWRDLHRLHLAERTDPFER
jgi:hypothetical protein